MDLGDFGRARIVERAVEDDVAVEPDRFRFHGDWFTLQGGVSPLVTMEFVSGIKDVQRRSSDAGARRDAAQQRLERTDDPAVRDSAGAEVAAAAAAATDANLDGMVVMHAYVKECIGEAEWPRFRAVVVRDAVDEDELLQVCAEIVQAITERPTRRSSASPDGPSTTGDGSTDGSGSPGATPGPGHVLGEVVQMPTDRLTEAERQRREFGALMVPVTALTRSSG